MMRRREFIALLGGAAASWPLSAHAQQSERVRRIGVLVPFGESDPVLRTRVTVFRDALAELGWVEGRNLRIDYGWAGDAGKLPGYAAELIAVMPDAIFVIGPEAAAALQRATRTVPIVFANISDPIGAGLISTLTQPGGNITGFASQEVALGAKRLELLKQIAPHVIRVACISDPSTPTWPGFFAEVEAAAPSLGLIVSAAPIRDAADIEATIDAFAREPNGGLIVLTSQAIVAHRDRIIALAIRHRLPAVYGFQYFVAAGGLASYGVDPIEFSRGAASYVDRILKGEVPGTLPIQFATKYKLVINLKTAKVLGLDPPIYLLARTDEVIE
jgi:putative ABC transport system substrate-binding protein